MFSLQLSREREQESLGKDPPQTPPAPCSGWIPATGRGNRGGDKQILPAKRTDSQAKARVVGLHADDIWKS